LAWARPGAAKRERLPQAARETQEALPDLGKVLESGRYKRQYRDHRLEWMLRSGGLPIVLEGMEKRTIRFSNEIA
jgi:glutathione S-transferase